MSELPSKDPPAPVVLTRHPTLYLEDGSVIIRTQALPTGADYKTLKEYAGVHGLDGLSDTTALILPKTIEVDDLDHLLEFIFNIKTYSPDEIPSLLGLCAILKLSHFLDVESGSQHANHHLTSHPHLGAPLRLFLACTYDVDEWIPEAFNMLMKTPIDELSHNDERLIGNFVYKLLIRTHAKIDKHRHDLTFYPPEVRHAPDCLVHSQCEKVWEAAWFGKAGSGMVSALLDAKIPGAAVYSTMEKFQVPEMRDICRVQTLSSLEDTPEKKSRFKKETTMIEEAIKELRAQL
ncbi:hypothetical protein DFH07DRAFT_957994 [Mycena maculata]|uniref:BTB domain-containing protein n=1 Tax=Mycena maculata TaxID=230809 RepID=A0AAD7J9Y3_9AGAR|nr:hypothetical protein DFH07DRAFT_957994 [Mycena maculata]